MFMKIKIYVLEISISPFVGETELKTYFQGHLLNKVPVVMYFFLSHRSDMQSAVPILMLHFSVKLTKTI